MNHLRLEAWPAREREHRPLWAWRRLAAAGLRRAAALLARLSRRLDAHAARAEPPAAHARLEFHAEAGAPEGALYLDGRLIGWLPGVQRL